MLGRYHDTGLRSCGSPAARHEQEMGGAIHELRACGIGLLEPREFIGKLTTARPAYRVPPGIRHESTMKQVKTAQFFDVETAGEIIQQLDRCKLVKAKCNMSAVAEVDFAPVPDVVLFQTADILDRVYSPYPTHCWMRAETWGKRIRALLMPPKWNGRSGKGWECRDPNGCSI